jgi:hypothetical protein
MATCSTGQPTAEVCSPPARATLPSRHAPGHMATYTVPHTPTPTLTLVGLRGTSARLGTAWQRPSAQGKAGKDRGTREAGHGRKGSRYLLVGAMPWSTGSPGPETPLLKHPGAEGVASVQKVPQTEGQSVGGISKEKCLGQNRGSSRCKGTEAEGCRGTEAAMQLEPTSRVHTKTLQGFLNPERTGVLFVVWLETMRDLTRGVIWSSYKLL